MREVQRKMDVVGQPVAEGSKPLAQPASRTGWPALVMWMERAGRIRTQQRNDKNKLYALHAPEVECIGKVQGAQALRVRGQGRYRRVAQSWVDDGCANLHG